MSSGKKTYSGKYKGNGGSAPITVSEGFKPEMVKVWSAEGQVILQEKMTAPKKFTDAAPPADLAADSLVISEPALGFVVTGNVAGVNSSGVDYFYEMY